MSEEIERRGLIESTHYNFAEGEYLRPLNEEISIRDYWRILVKRGWFILAVLVLVLAVVVLQTFTATPIFSSTARIQIDPESANVLP